MTVLIRLTDTSTNIIDEVKVDNVLNKRCINYYDNESNACEICIYDEGICLFRQCEDHILELHLRNNNYVKITTVEGECKISAKVVDFKLNDDILVMRYIIENVERVLEIIYRG